MGLSGHYSEAPAVLSSERMLRRAGRQDTASRYREVPVQRDRVRVE